MTRSCCIFKNAVRRASLKQLHFPSYFKNFDFSFNHPQTHNPLFAPKQGYEDVVGWSCMRWTKNVGKRVSVPRIFSAFSNFSTRSTKRNSSLAQAL